MQSPVEGAHAFAVSKLRGAAAVSKSRLLGREARTRCRILIVGACLALLLLPTHTHAQTGAPATARGQTAEQRAARAFEKVRANPLELRAFLLRMPKGGDLHNHLDGAVYAESYIRAAAEDNLCVALASLSFAKAESVTPSNPPRAMCADGQVPVAQVSSNQHLYDSLINAFSMRGFMPGPGATAHDHFFDTFAKFAGTDRRHMGEWLDEVSTRAAAQNEQYLELILTPDFTYTDAIAKKIGWRDDLAGLRQDLLAAGLRDDLAAARSELDDAERFRRTREHCGQADEAPACRV